MSLYANLLKKANAGIPSTSSAATISGEPVKYSFKKTEDESREEKKKADAALRFQPVIRRQQQTQQKPRPRPGNYPKGSQDKQGPPSGRKPPSAGLGSAPGDSIENWIDEDADDYYVAEYTRHKQEEKERQKEAKKKRNKKKNQQNEIREVDWNASYDPEQPVRLADYRGSMEELDAKYEWKQRLHAHQRKKNKSEQSRKSSEQRDAKFAAFAPPSNYDFAPPKQESSAASAHSRTPPQSTSNATAPPPTSNYGRVPPPTNYASVAPPSDYEAKPPKPQVKKSRFDVGADGDYKPPPPAAYTPSATPSAAQPSPAPAHQPTASPSTNIPPQFTASSAPQPHLQGLPFPPSLPNGMPFPPAPWQLPPGAVPPPPPGMAFPIPHPGMGMPYPGMGVPQSGMGASHPGMGFPPPPPQYVSSQIPPSHVQPAAPTPPLSTQASAPPPPQAAATAPTQQPMSSATISRAPVRYTQPSPTPSDDQNKAKESQSGLGFNASTPNASEPTSDNDVDMAEDEPRSNRPGQKGFAKRLLQKYGWKQGEGLGAQGDGITTILQHQTQKRKKKPDHEGGGWSAPAAMGKIVGGKKRKIEGADDDSESTAWSIVARFDGMLKGLDIDHEIVDGDLMQRMGEKMAEYGHVERLYIHRPAVGSEPVFVKFTSALSAYRAVQAGEGKDFLANGRIVKASFWPEEKFTSDIFE